VADRELLVRIVGDDRSLQQAFTRSGRSAQQFERQTSTVGQNLKRGFAAAGLTLGISASLSFANRLAQSASALNEEISKSQKIFGDSADDIDAWAHTTANAFGISRTAALQATGIFGNLFRVVDIAPTQAAAMSRSLVELAADLASFNNASPDDVLQALRSGLIGEAEPLRRYGVLLSETRVQQVAMAESGKTNVRALTNQEKALARYHIILQDTIPAQGDFADTADQAANAQRRASAEAADLSANVGQILVPALTGGALAFAAFAHEANAAIGAIVDFRAALRDTHAFDGFNSAVDGAASHASNFFLGLRDGIPFLDEFKGKLGLGGKTLQEQIDEASGAGTLRPGRESGTQGAAVGANATANAEAEARRQLTASQKRFAEFTKGLELKLKRAGLSPGVADDLAVLLEIQAAIERQIRTEGHTYKLENDLVDIQLQIARTRREGAERVDRAEETADKEVTTAAERRKARRERAAAAARAAQFEAIGLTAQGEQRVPGIGALRRRGQALLRQISGTDLDTAANRERIGAVLSEQFKDAGREVRQAILDMFNEISGALNTGSKSLDDAMKTPFRVVNTTEVLSGLGLSEEETQRLRSRLSRLGPGGTTPQPGGAGGAFGVNVGGGGNVIVNGPVTVVADNTNEFGRELQRQKRRSTVSRTGSGAGRSLGGV
jgi:hypothetical protein